MVRPMAASDERQRGALLELVNPQLVGDERVVAVLPFANTPRRPKGLDGKVRDGLWQSARRYRPLLLTDRRLFVFDARRTPHPQGVLVEFPTNLINVVRLVSGTLGRQTLVLDLPAAGEVPFELGRLDAVDLRAFTDAFDFDAES
jgi:hypothetical protein